MQENEPAKPTSRDSHGVAALASALPPRRAGAPIALFLLAWFVGTFYFWGDLGKWVDDWGFHLRDLSTGLYSWADIFTINYWHTGFRRPYHIHISAAIQTVLWRHDWAIHLIVAAAHGINAGLAWKVFRRMGLDPRACIAAALMFLVYPAGHEAIFWLSAICATMGVCFLLLCTLAVQRVAAGEWSWRKAAWFLPVLFTIGWWYESPAACAPAIGLAFLASAPTARPLKGRLRDTMLLGIVGGLSFAFSAVLLIASSPASERGSSSSLVTAANIQAQAEMIFAQARQHLEMENFARGALVEGWRAFWSKPVQGSAVLVGLVIASVSLLRWWNRCGDGATPQALPGRGGRPGLVIPPASSLQLAAASCYGLAIIAASIAPAIAVRDQWFASRLAYAPVLGATVLFGVLAHVALRHVRLASLAIPRLAFAIVVIGLTAVFAVMLVGVQSVWHHRMLSDRKTFADLARLVPNPAPNTAFLPLLLRDKRIDTGSGRFDGAVCGPFELAPSAESVLMQLYRRRDVYGLPAHRWMPPTLGTSEVVGATPEGLLLARGGFREAPFATDTMGRRLIPWDQVIGFQVGKRGQVTIVPAARLEDDLDSARNRVVNLASAPGTTDAAPPPVIPLISLPSEKLDWNWEATGASAVPESTWVASRCRSAVTMHPAIEGISDRGSLVGEIAARAESSRLVWRAALTDAGWQPAEPLTDGVRLTVWVDGEVLCTQALTPSQMKATNDWVFGEAVLPASDRPRQLRMVIDAGVAGSASCDWCAVTPPALVRAEPATPESSRGEPAPARSTPSVPNTTRSSVEGPR